MRASQHLAELKGWHTAYIGNGPGELVREHNPDTGLTHHKLRIVRQPPPVMSAITFDLINCLRSSLDHVVYDATIELTGNAAPENTKFPFGNDVANARSRVGATPPALVDFIMDRYKPFDPQHGGDEPLFGLNKLRNQKIHRLLSTYAHQPEGGHVAVNQFVGAITILNEWDGAKQELTFAITETPDIGNLQANITLEIGFDRPAAFEGKPFLSVLTNLLYLVDRVVLEIEAETTRIKAT